MPDLQVHIDREDDRPFRPHERQELRFIKTLFFSRHRYMRAFRRWCGWFAGAITFGIAVANSRIPTLIGRWFFGG